MTYRRDMIELSIELENQANQQDFANDPQASEKAQKLHRQAETLRFILDHPDQMDLGNPDSGESDNLGG